MKQVQAIYKPPGISSNQFLTQLKKISGIKKIGHAGTLDPLAEGILVVGLTREGTKQLTLHLTSNKEYWAVVELGKTSTTDDAEGLIPESNPKGITPPSAEKINEVLQSFIGTIQQTPPQHSAVKIKGRPAYQLARKGLPVTLAPKKVQITEIKLLNYIWPEITIQVTCGAGVYIRSLARDIGIFLGTGAYLKKLIRTRVGAWTLEQTISINEFKTQYGQTNWI